MVTILSGVGLLLVTLAVFSIFSLKMPKGSLAMGGMADAAVATFLVEAIHKYISGDLIGIAFLREVGDISGSIFVFSIKICTSAQISPPTQNALT